MITGKSAPAATLSPGRATSPVWKESPNRHLQIGFGLCFASAEPMPGWPAADGHTEFDVELHLRGLPSWAQITGKRDDRSIWRSVVESKHLNSLGQPLVRVEENTQGGVLGAGRRFRYHDGATYAVDEDGRNAWLEWPDTMTQASAWPYFAGPVLTWLLRLNGRVVLHAAVVEVGERAILLAGPSGAGKSTTAAAFSQAGYRILSDDTAALSGSPGDGQILVWPDSPALRIWPDATAALPQLGAESLPPLCEGWDKRILEVASFCSEPRTVAVVVCLQAEEISDTVIRSVPRARALPTLIAHAAAPELSTRDMRRAEFELLADLAEDVPVLEATRGDQGAAELVDRICRHLASVQ